MLLEDVGEAANRMVRDYGVDRALILLDLYSRGAGVMRGYYWRIQMLIMSHIEENNERKTDGTRDFRLHPDE